MQTRQMRLPQGCENVRTVWVRCGNDGQAATYLRISGGLVGVGYRESQLTMVVCVRNGYNVQKVCSLILATSINKSEKDMEGRLQRKAVHNPALLTCQQHFSCLWLGSQPGDFVRYVVWVRQMTEEHKSAVVEIRFSHFYWSPCSHNRASTILIFETPYDQPDAWIWNKFLYLATWYGVVFYKNPQRS